MTLKNSNFENLIKVGLLKEHIAKRDEIETHMITAQERLQDALLPNISKTGKFIGLYDASHALCMAATKMHGYRPGDDKGHRQGLFSIIDQVLPAASKDKATLEVAHRVRNLMEYDGKPPELQNSQLEALTEAATSLMEEVKYIHKAWLKKFENN
jgi:hypothetical protein